jgi:hypothetical protein
MARCFLRKETGQGKIQGGPQAAGIPRCIITANAKFGYVRIRRWHGLKASEISQRRAPDRRAGQSRNGLAWVRLFVSATVLRLYFRQMCFRIF